MIQVLERAFGVLERLAAAEPLTLAELTAQTGMKKPTLCLILKSLVELGVVQKVETGVYATAEGLQRLARGPRRLRLLRCLAEDAAAHLAAQVHESVVAAQVYRGARCMIAQATFDQALMVNTTLQTRGTFYNSATGRVLLAFMSDSDLDGRLATHGLPPAEIWPEAVTKDGLQAELARIRKAGVVIMPAAGGTVQFLSVPVFGPDGRAWLALGVSLPTVRYVTPHNRDVLEGLRRAAGELADQLALAEGTSSPF